MAGDSEVDELAIRMQVLDTILPDPPRRAAKVAAFLESYIRDGGISFWDLVCFANETLTAAAATTEPFQNYIRPLNKVVYSLHYLYPHQNGIADDKQWGAYQSQLALRGVDPQSFKGASLFRASERGEG